MCLGIVHVVVSCGVNCIEARFISVWWSTCAIHILVRDDVFERHCFFFFFKQKTAYDIVSRDWSSDVCSPILFAGRIGALSQSPESYWPVQKTNSLTLPPTTAEVQASLPVDRRARGGHEVAAGWHREIGRASGRERG